MRARGLGIPFQGEPGEHNAITDVAGVSVGYLTWIEDLPDDVFARTGITVVLPRARDRLLEPVFSGVYVLNGAGELAGIAGVQEFGSFLGPIGLTNTHSVGMLRDAIVSWLVATFPEQSAETFYLPVASETYDGHLNDINRAKLESRHLYAAIDAARPGPIEEGSVGGGTGMRTFEFKAGNGTASRVVQIGGQRYCVGGFVQANFGRREQLTIAGVPVGVRIPAPASPAGETGSIVGLIATDAPLLPHQLRRLATRASLGIARCGAIAGNSSGDLFLAFSTASQARANVASPVSTAEFLEDEVQDVLFAAAVQVIEEAVVNSLIASGPMLGRAGRYCPALPHELVVRLLREHGRLTQVVP